MDCKAQSEFMIYYNIFNFKQTTHFLHNKLKLLSKTKLTIPEIAMLKPDGAKLTGIVGLELEYCISKT